MIWHPNMPDSYKNTVVCGNSKPLAECIPDQSVDMIFADPVYDQLDDYAWLAELAARILKPDCPCLVWCSSIKQYEVQPIMKEYLTFVLPLTYTKVAKAFKVWGYKTFLWSTPCLWFQNGSSHFHGNHKWLIDTVIDRMETNAVISMAAPPKKTHKWHKNPEAYVYWMLRLTKPGAVVYDPFAGSGSMPVECKKHGRNFIASEIDPKTAEAANARLEGTQTIGDIFVGEQLSLFSAGDFEEEYDDADE